VILRSLAVHRLPGIPPPGFALDGLAEGVNVVVGPNASGKTSLLRALRAALYEDEAREPGVSVEALFALGDGASLRARRLGTSLQWQGEAGRMEPPPLPDHRFLACYTLGLEDLLAAEGGPDALIAERLGRELAGGYDLRAVRNSEPFVLKANHGRPEARRLQEADERLHQQQREHEALQREQASLAELQAEKTAAEAARRDAEALDHALELLEARRERLRQEQRAEEFPAAMERMHGDERGRLDSLQAERRECAEAQARAQSDRSAAERDYAATGLARSPLAEAALGDLQQRAQRLREAEQELRRQEAALNEAAAERQHAVAQLGGEPDRELRITPAVLASIEDALAQKRDCDARIAVLEARRRGLAEEGADPEPLRRARAELLRWLAAPRDPPWTALRATAAALLALAGLGGIGLAAARVHWAAALLAIPFSWGLYLLLRGGAGEAERAGARRHFEETGVAAPEAWEETAVKACLTALDARLREAEARADGHRQRGELEVQLGHERERSAEVGTSLDARARELGLHPSRVDAAFHRWVALAGAYDAAARRCRTLQGAIEAARDTRQRGCRELATFLATHGEALETEAPDAAIIEARLSRLAVRVRARDDAQRRIEAAQRELERLAAQSARLEQAHRELFAQAGLEPGDEAALDARLERLPQWQQWRQQLHQARAIEADRRRDLAEREDLLALVEAGDAEALGAQRDRCRDQAGRADWLASEITRIETLVDEAGRQRRLEGARAERQMAEDALRERRREALLAEAGALLLEEVGAEHERSSQPEALRRAAAWFLSFTHGQFELVLEDADGGRFAARDTAAGERRALSALSTGTRMQLLLAVRIAFALEAERGRTALPFVLDEALTAADPERFRAVAESLHQLAEQDGRQVFYLTAQPDDAAYWRELDPAARVIDLAAVRGAGEALTDPAALAVPEREPVPAPAGAEPEAYAVRLGVPPVDPWAEAGAIHLFYLLRDDLALLHRLLERAIERAGPLRALLAGDPAVIGLDAAAGARLERRLAGAEAWIAAWRQGRGRPVDRQALERSGAVSDTFIDRVAALADRCGGDAEALLAALAAGEVKRFLTDKREQLADWLSEHGYLDPQPPLEPAEITRRVAAALLACCAPGEDAYAEARQLADSLAAGAAAGGQGRDA